MTDRSTGTAWFCMRQALMVFLILIPQLLWAQAYDGMREAIEQGGFGAIKSIVVSHRGEIIYEEYFRGTGVGDLQPVYSVTKSVGSALIGIANRQGKIHLNQSLDEFFSDIYPIGSGVFAGKENITVEAVLQQRHGVEWDEWTLSFSNPLNPVSQAVAFGDWYKYFLNRPMDAQPGEKFTYSTMNSTLMSRMIRKVSGHSPREFAMQELFGPLGIQEIDWEGYSVQGRGFGLTDFPNPEGDEPLGYMLWLKPMDMVKFGELYRNGGVYNGHRLLDKSWVEASWVNYSNAANTELFAGNQYGGYGYQWWASAIKDNRNRLWKLNYASGWANQFIIVVPDLDLVVVSVADDFNYDGPGIGTLLRNYILAEINPVLDERFTGAWYNPDTDGQGLTLEILDDGQRLIGFWYTFDEHGDKRWFTFDGNIEGSEAEASIVQTSGGLFLKPDPITTSEWGTAHFSVVDCDQITFKIISEEITTSVALMRLTGSCKRP